MRQKSCFLTQTQNMFKTGLIIDNIRISLNAIRSNILRTVLTILIISIGIMSLVGILTAVESIKSTITDEFQRMGSNTFTIREERMGQSHGQSSRRNQANRRISYEEAMQFKRDYSFPAEVSIFIRGSSTATIRHLDQKTEPNIPVFGVDENYILSSGNDISKGRNFLSNEVLSGDNLVIIGSEMARILFRSEQDPIDQLISIGNLRYRVIGILSEKGTSFGGDGDRLCLVPLNNARQNFPVSNTSYTINVMPADALALELAISEAEGLFRNIRRLTVFDNNNFRITKSDSLVSMFIDNIRVVTLGATLIGLITLLGASIGLMNIMLVSVAERTVEIGIRKAIGANSVTIKQQFLFESVFIGQLGGFLGILLGIIAGNMVGLITGGGFIVPWLWILLGVFLCFIVGIASGYIPAVKASRLDPIVALRYE